MLNLIKMDLYRMFKMKSLIITTLIYTFYAYIFTTAELSLDAEPLNTTGQVVLIISSMLPLTFICIFTVLFITFDTHTGYIKSYIGQIPGRIYRLASKLICCCIYLLLACAYIVACQLIIGSLLGGNAAIDDVGELFKYMALAYLMHFALICVILMITTAFKSHVAPIICAVCMSLGVAQIFTSIIYRLLDVAFDKNFDPTDYLITARIEDITNGFFYNQNHYSIRSTVLLSLVYIGISLIMSVLIFRKKDVA